MESYNQIKVTVPVSMVQTAQDVMTMMERCGFKERFKYDMYFWSTDKVFEHISAL